MMPSLPLPRKRVPLSSQPDSDFATNLALSGKLAPSLVLFRSADRLIPSQQAALLIANLPTMEPELEPGRWSRCRPRICGLAGFHSSRRTGRSKRARSGDHIVRSVGPGLSLSVLRGLTG
jgi:hypothetical protein